MQNELTSGSLMRGMVRFSVPYLIASFLQTFYGMADLFLTGRFNSAAQVTAVSVGSQIMHMITVMIAGLVMGTTVSVSHAVGAKNERSAARTIGNSVTIFAAIGLLITGVLLIGAPSFLQILQTPDESFEAAKNYVMICFAGVPFIVAYNVISGIFRGLGDTKHPMMFVAVAGVLNIALDILLIGVLHLGASGAALATVCSQAVSVLLALNALRKVKTHIALTRKDFALQRDVVGKVLGIGVPISAQDGFIQVSFLVITMIANMRGVVVAAAVGIVEKVISFLFLVPSAMHATVSAITAQNVGAGLHERGKKTLFCGIAVCVGFGTLISVISCLAAPQIVGVFVNDEPQVVVLGAQYLRAYVFDCIFAGIHFCFSGYFSAYGKSMYSFLHNTASILLMRIPGAYLASVLFPQTLLPMGVAAPLGSLLSDVICVAMYVHFQKNAFGGRQMK